MTTSTVTRFVVVATVMGDDEVVFAASFCTLADAKAYATVVAPADLFGDAPVSVVWHHGDDTHAKALLVNPDDGIEGTLSVHPVTIAL